MGTSYTGFRGRGFWSRDETLALWYLLLCEQVAASDDVPEWLRDAEDEWRTQACVGGGGVAYAHPDESWSDEQWLRNVLSTIPLGRAGTADEVAALIAFVASDECAYATGAAFVLDGGMTAV